ncbi:hypothetical protein K1718_00425 [Roseibium porphyridii]|uniref:Amino acid ABC transporter permease n=1 Tax=Roseibium porphyridii TaxID=2866279 RepID=A0ABY8F2Z5_9HYPH|nr:hypothetical protein [Roseibium sp. KMA01]WFE89857.1 hypothetical protein K1718_00425 [Roseibium sp. KMA01]
MARKFDEDRAERLNIVPAQLRVIVTVRAEYPELVSAGNTAMNQTGQAIELIAIYMLFYVSINIVITKLSHILEARYEW